ncbi:MAG TPA: glycoside hydrolase family 3 C-terminal domain-containing protein [Candidatus Cybelea sp.]|nr:glycoside hydrolase family 3 C-terminal domain-containing protein [Candidatus Cybelea sp.]
MFNRKFIAAIAALAMAIPMARTETERPSPANIDERVNALLAQMTLEEKLALIGGVNDFYTRPIQRLGIKSLRMSDGPMGVHDYGPTTAYPAGIALAASWDTELARRVGVSMGRDARARGVNIVLAPGLNIYRAPMNGRNFEYFGEDPYLASRMAVGIVEGIQSEGVVATVKHFVANNMEYGRQDHSSDVDERTLREIYLPAFEAAVREAHAAAVMDAYNLVNGEHMTENAHLNKEILKQEWGFDGILMSDWGATHDGVAAANRGLDLEMPSAVYMTPETLIPALQKGAVQLSTIDDKVRRILRVAMRFGFFDHEQSDLTIPLYDQKGRDLAREEARDSMVLLKNQFDLLPFDPSKLKTVAVIGPDAYPAVPGGGGSSQTQPFNQVSLLEGISNYLGPRVNVLYAADSVSPAEVADGSEFRVSPQGPPGLQAEYFDNQDLNGAPALQRVDAHVDFDWGEGSFAEGHPVDHFSARWTGYYVPAKTRDYTFYASTDDGVRLFLDDEQIINDWTSHPETLHTVARHLEGGHAYKIRLEYFEETGSAIARFGAIAAEDVFGRQTKPLAARVDAVILCVGFDPSTEGEGADRSFQLPGGQDELIRQIASVNKNVVVVLTAGGNADMTGWIARVPAVLHAWYPGEEGGTALAQILFGDYSPSGKLPASFERRWEDNPTYHSYYPQTDKRIAYTEGIFLGYRYYDKSATKPLFPFGYGLSYTRFQYSNLEVSPRRGPSPDSVSVSFDVKNVGNRAGAEIAEVYVGDSHARVPRPVKELKGFAKVFLEPGEHKRVQLTLNRRSFSYYDVQKKTWTADPGDFSILVGSSSARIELTGTFSLAQ